MNKVYRPVLCLCIMAQVALGVEGQQTDTTRRGDSSGVSAAYADSVMTNDSLLRDLSQFIDSINRPKSLLVFEIGAGNGFFTSKNATAGTGYITQLFLSPTVTYVNKCGLGVSGSAYATESNGQAVLYQGVISPSYDFLRKNWAAGISYSRYLNKDTESYFVAPLRNDFYGYVIYKKFWLEPGAALDFSFDSYILEQFILETEDPPATVIADRSLNAHIFSNMLTVQHDFDWNNVLGLNDRLAFTPMLMALSAASNYNIKTITHLGRGEAARFAEVEGPTEYEKNAAGSAYSVESFATLLNAVYTSGHFLFSPQILCEYFLNTSPGVAPLRVSCLINIGMLF